MKRILSCVHRFLGIEKETELARSKVAKHNYHIGNCKLQLQGAYGHHAKVNDWIYIYYICKESGLLIFDRSVSRYGLGPDRARELVDKHNERGHESFYTIGTITKHEALS